jgi:hypothetical protein
MNFLAQAMSTALNPVVGQLGQTIIIGKAAMPGATCCLTDAAALSLSNLDRPT